MTEYTSLYRYSLEEAVRWNERDLWRESHKENCSCARAIEEAIKDGYHDNRLDGDIAKAVIERFGYDRLNWVLANTVRENMQGPSSMNCESGRVMKSTMLSKSVHPLLMNSSMYFGTPPVMV